MGTPLCLCLLLATLGLNLGLSAVFSSRLLAPLNVRLSSYNMNLVLRWSRPENQSREVYFSTQLWSKHPAEPRAACTNTTALHCDLTDPALRLDILEFGSYHAAVRTQYGGQRSEWVNSSALLMDQDTVIGPPGVSLETEGAGLEVIMTEPKLTISKMAAIFGPTQYNISYWPRGRPDQVVHELVQQNRVVLSDLEPRTDYCVRVRVHMEPEKNHNPTETSEEVCGTTDHKPSDPWPAAVLTFIAVGLAVALVVVAVVYRGRIQHFLCPDDELPQHLSESPPSLCHLIPETEVYHPLTVRMNNDEDDAVTVRTNNDEDDPLTVRSTDGADDPAGLRQSNGSDPSREILTSHSTAASQICQSGEQS